MNSSLEADIRSLLERDPNKSAVYTRLPSRDLMTPIAEGVRSIDELRELLETEGIDINKARWDDKGFRASILSLLSLRLINGSEKDIIKEHYSR